MTASVSGVISAVILFVLGVTALGFIITYPFFSKQHIQKSLFGNFIVGIVGFYTLVLCQVKLSYFSPLFTLFILAAGSLLYWKCHKTFTSKISTNYKNYLSPLSTIVFIGVSLWFSRYLIERILFEPVFQWDARVNWFLYAKKFFYADGLNENTYLIFANSITDVHPGYPKIVPAMAGYFASYFGFWNEHLPKLSLIVFYLGILIALYSAKPIHWAWKVVVLVMFVGFNPYFQSTANNTFFLSIGYVDSWLAIYAALSMLFLTLYIRHFQKEYLFNGITTALMLANVKNEGLPIALIIIGMYIISLLLFHLKNRRYLLANFGRLLKLLPVLVSLIAPIVIWGYHKRRLGIVSADNVDFSPLFNTETYGQTFSQTKFDLIEKGFLNLVFLPNFWYTYIFLLIGVIAYLLLQKTTKKTLACFLSEYFFVTTSGFAVITLMTITFWVLPMKILPVYIATGADRLGLHSYYMVGVSLFCFCTTLFFIPYREKHFTSEGRSVNNANSIKVTTISAIITTSKNTKTSKRKK